MDKKARLVLPLTLRENLGVSEYVLFEFEGNRIVVRRAEHTSGRPVSKNCREVLP